MLLRSVPRPNGFIEPCLPSSAPKPPAGAGWIPEIKLDGFRLLARRDAAGVRLLTRRGIDWTNRYPTIAAAVAALACRSCLIDGEVVICGEDGIPVFDRLRYGRQPQAEAVLFAFDLLELAGKDLRRTPVEERKHVLAKLLRKSSWALHFNEHIAEPGDIVFRHAQARLRGHRVETARLALHLRPHAALDQNEEPGSTRSEAGSGGGLGKGALAVSHDVPLALGKEGATIFRGAKIAKLTGGTNGRAVDL
jgi:bifunctional non-homologous end joining protein LigD